MLWTASVLSTVSSDTEPTVVIAFDSAKYIFNAGENTTRAFLQSRQNWKKTRALFLTSIGTQRASGLPGLLMTFADAGQSQVHITGPSGLLHLMASMRKYTYRENLLVTPSEIPLSPVSLVSEHQPVYKDNNITVFALPVLPEAPSGLPSSAGPAGVTATSVCPSDSTGSLKRRREPSPYQPSKRLSNQGSATPFPDTIPPVAPSLREVVTKSDFDPSSLNGEMAQAWRQLVIQTMFPATQVVIANTGQNGPGKRKGKRKAEDHEVKPREDAPSKSARASHPTGLNKPLPVPECSLIGSSNPSLKPTVAYAIVGPRIRGKFDEQKAVALGLQRGPLRAKLSKGECVTVQVKDDNGNTFVREIKPEDCIGESVTPGVVLVLDTPTLAHIPGLVSGFADSEPFARYLWKYTEGSKEHMVRAVFHLCGENVLEDERYKAFMNGFGPEVHHVVASRRHLPNAITFTSAAYSQLRLNQLDPNIFPVQKFSCDVEKAISDVCGLPANTTFMRANLSVDLHPPRPPAQNLDAEKSDIFHPAVSSNSFLDLPELTRTRFMEAQAAVQSDSGPQLEGMPGKDVMICPLGTGSAMPSKFRNVSATLIHIPDHGYILLDVGEGTWGQLARKFGDDPTMPSNVWQILRELKCIFISHMHGDHHIGLAKLLAMRQRLDPPADRPMYIVGNQQVFLYLREYAALEDLGLSPGSKNPVTLILVEAIHWANTTFSSNRLSYGASRDSISALSDLCSSLGLKSLRSVDVAHRTTCHGVIIKHTDGWSIVYSGDTIPTQKLVQAGENATLLIHEATMADDQVEMAAAKMHSTVGQAIDIGKRMKAQNILLTHFSARYPTMPPSVMTPHKPGDPTLALAFDHANIKIGDMWKMNAYMKAIEQSFIDLEDEGNDDTTQLAEVDIA
ncbi:hypothetical protein PAXINDRAFT_172647 [Paxillus involutus ATCC 200175]|uniref:ribonuclease Z n=1 Tax=Paxillus involutus ATCC 200175 TaxID=664439 RepID=A0A0C9T0D2_PAXIN|nr:hypothetical protein PAXINDRAFT_172647 [Paxillus involutus ATCC 200175]